jgi:hypothetical protein
VPLEDGNPMIAATGATMVLDATAVYGGMDEHAGVAYTLAHYANTTTTLVRPHLPPFFET